MNSLLISEKEKTKHEKDTLEEGCEVLEAVKTIGRMLVVYYTNVKKERDN